MMIEQRRARKISISGRTIFYLAFVLFTSFLIGRVSIAAEMYPFGAALLIACFSNDKAINPFIAMAGTYASLCTVLGKLSFPEYNFCVISILTVALIVFKIIKLNMRPVVVISTTAAAYFISAFIFKSTVLLSFAYTAGELMITLLAAKIFSNVIRLISARRKRTLLDEIELLSISFVAVITLAGIGDVQVAGIHIINILACLIAILASYSGGSAIGTLISAFCVFSCMIAGISIEYCAMLVVCTAVSGLFNRFIKLIYAPIFLAAAAICTVAVSAPITTIIEFTIASAIFLIIPQIFIDNISNLTSPAAIRRRNFSLVQKRFHEVTTGEIKNMSKVLKNAAKIFKSSADNRKQSGIQYAIANIPEQCCEKCDKYDVCWDKQFENTYNFMQQMYSRYKIAGKITEKDMVRDYVMNCQKPKRLQFTINSVFKEYTMSAHWENKVMESRTVLAEQLKGVSSALEQLEDRITDEMVIDDDTEDELITELDKNGFSVKDVSIIEKGDDKLINLRVKNCGGNGACKKAIKSIASSICGCPMSLSREPICSTGICSLSYERAQNIALKTAVSRRTKEGSIVSGDTYSLKPLPDGRYMMLICDGMGSGERAQKESFAAANLIEDFYTAGFESKDVLNMINKLMLLSSSDEVFSALDLCIVDLRNSTAQFTKIGAPHSYIISENSVKRLSAGALPLGILEDCEPREHTAELSPGDLIVIFSDGIAEAELNDNNLYSKITSVSPSDNVKVIADKIISSTVASSEGKAKDDLTVIVSRVVAA